MELTSIYSKQSGRRPVLTSRWIRGWEQKYPSSGFSLKGFQMQILTNMLGLIKSWQSNLHYARQITHKIYKSKDKTNSQTDLIPNHWKVCWRLQYWSLKYQGLVLDFYSDHSDYLRFNIDHLPEISHFEGVVKE